MRGAQVRAGREHDAAVLPAGAGRARAVAPRDGARAQRARAHAAHRGLRRVPHHRRRAGPPYLYIYAFTYIHTYHSRFIPASQIFEELDGRAVSALGVRSRKLSTGLNGQSYDG
jgi:hypothetical protein